MQQEIKLERVSFLSTMFSNQNVLECTDPIHRDTTALCAPTCFFRARGLISTSNALTTLNSGFRTRIRALNLHALASVGRGGEYICRRHHPAPPLCSQRHPSLVNK